MFYLILSYTNTADALKLIIKPKLLIEGLVVVNNVGVDVENIYGFSAVDFWFVVKMEKPNISNSDKNCYDKLMFY